MKIKRKTFVGGLLATLCACATVITGLSLSGSAGTAYAAAATKKATGAYLDLSGSGNILNGFEGAQKEYVYFGDNDGTAVKWRVLDTGDNNKYGNGMLLWADKQLGKCYYNSYYINPDYAFWGTSQIRATLNGGTYYKAVSSNTAVPSNTQDVNEDVSYYGKLFTLNEKSAVVAADSYVTDNWGLNTTQSQYLYKKEGITVTASANSTTDTVNGKYNTNRSGAGTAQFATYDTTAGTVKETTDGDKLFLLDYYDVNNVSYGFGDGGLIHANKVDSSWTPSSDWYPGRYDGASRAFNNITSDYLKFSGEAAEDYWLRPAGRYGTAGASTGSFALVVDEVGSIEHAYVAYSYGVRPAFNFDSSKIAYATTAKPSSGWTDMSRTSTKPEYRLYLKDSDYTTNTSKAKATLGESNGTLNIKYNNPTGKSGGKLVLLLSEKTKNDGSVAYQTAVEMNSTSATDNAFATVALPSSVNYNDYNLTLLYASANVTDTDSSETIYCSYAIENSIAAPSNITVTYSGASKWITDLSGTEKPAWLDLNIYNNTAYTSVKTVEYTDNMGNPVSTIYDSATSSSFPDIKEAGAYKVTMTAASGIKWAGDTATGGDKQFTITINKADPVVTATAGQNNIYVTDGLPKNADGTANVNNTADGGTAGTFTWNANQTPSPTKTSYSCKFTPTDTNNYNTKDDCNVSITFIEDEISGVTASVAVDGTGTDKLYTSNTLEKLKAAPFSLTVKLVHESGYLEDTSDYTLSVLKDGSPQSSFHAGANTVQVESNGYDCSFTVEVIAAEIDSIKSVTFNQNGDKIYPNTSLDDIEKYFTVQAYWNYNTSKFETLDKDNFKLQGTLVPGTGTSSLFIVYTKGGADVSYPVPVGALNNITVDYLTYDMDGVELTGDKTVTYDGQPHALTLSGTLPDGVTAGNVTYTPQGGTPSTTAPTDAGTYTVKVSFTGDTVNYNAINDVTATLTIKQAKVEGITFADEVKPEITGTNYTLEATGVPSWVTVTYSVTDKDNNPLSGTSFSAAGTYKFTATFTHSDPNYEQLAPMTATLIISDKPPVEGADDIVVEPTVTATYTGSPVDYAAQNVPNGVDVSYSILKDGVAFSGTEIKDVGVYTVTVSFDTGAAYAPIADKTCVVTVKKADVDMSGVKFADETVTGNGKPHVIEATDLPQGVTVEYEYKGVKQTAPFEFTEVGEYTVKAYFTYEDEDNYEAIKPVEATLTISDAVVESISANVEDGAKFDINGTLDDVKAKIKAEIHFNNGAKEQAKVEDLTIDFATLREGGLLEVGTQTITVTYNDGENDFTTTVQIEVARAKVALPVYNGSLKYTGDTVKPAASDFEGFDSALMTLVESKTVAGLNAGAYKAVFALKDSERYQWARATTLKKSVLAAVVYDEVVLEDYEAAVDWNLAKAKITATKANGKLPVFASESYNGSFADIVGLKYYTDETCAEEVAADELGYSTKYFVKAELLDSANFELDETALTLSKTAFEYTTPEKQLTTWEKIVKFLSINWLWIVIAVVALILLILIIALAARAAKRKREREEQRRLEEKEEKKREQEEREERCREEREERMARMSQQQMMMPQMMPQMMQQQMPMQQAMPQQVQAQPVAAAGSASELAEIKAEISALRAEQNLRDVSALKAEQQVTQTKIDLQFANLLSRLGVEQVQGGISVNWLEEMVDKAVQKALAKNDKAEAQAAKPEGATAQVPPDAVMTTVTTTKIDTTKKPVQTAQAPAPVRTVVRNVVAPMPVDDGRVFDVGGFYKPADPLTDNIDDILGNEDKQD